MKKFSFRLESVRRLRSAVEEERKRAFAAAARLYHREREALRALLEREGEARERLAEELAAGCPGEVAAALSEFLRGNALRIRAQAERTEKARLRMEEERRLLVEASKERKVVDRLRERALERHLYQASREEQGFLDEVAGVRFLIGENQLASWRKGPEGDGARGTGERG
ncbi:MAG: flagellar export protein FliJ [Actinobacteria bacterium]|nr:flagellar export protein FliJ [Actinomycetota bacterium]